jgi:hypothetical protein
LAIGIEHLLLLVKVLMSSFLIDVPESVKRAIKKRPKLELKAA